MTEHPWAGDEDRVVLGALLLHDDRLELCRVAGLQVGREVSTGNLRQVIVEITN